MSTAIQYERNNTLPTVRETIRLFGGVSDVPCRRDVLTITADFVDYLVVERNSSPNTIEAYSRDLRDLVDHLGNQDVETITMVQLRSFLKRQTELNGASTVGRKLSAIRSFFDFCLREGLVKTNHATPLKAPKREERLPRHETLDGIGKLLEAPNDSVLGLRDRAILEVMYSAGLRVSELIGLNDEDVDLEAGTVRVIGKGNRQRLSHIGQRAQDALLAWFAVRETEGAVYTNYKGGRLSVRSVQKMVDKYTVQAGLRKLTPHALRHSMASHLLNNGADIRSVQEMLGHQSITSTQIYTHISVSRQAAVHAEFHPRG